MDANLIAALQSDATATRIEAAESLCHLGEEARPAAVLLVRACADESDEVREWAVAALEEIGPPDVSDAGDLAERRSLCNKSYRVKQSHQ